MRKNLICKNLCVAYCCVCRVMGRPAWSPFSIVQAPLCPSLAVHMANHLVWPPEWAPQKAIWIGWPSDLDNWPEDMDGARVEVAAFAAACDGLLDVHLVASTEHAATSARHHCPKATGVHVLPMGDIWLRDTGPVFVVVEGEIAALTFDFNGWGGRFILEGDTETADAILSITGHASKRHDFILEGGSIDQNGAGMLLTTRQCLLNPNRNAAWDEAKATKALQKAFGASRIVWLGDGLIGDHTDGHVDNIARFIGPQRVVCQRPGGDDDPNHQIYAAIERDLRAAGLDVVTIPSPGRVSDCAGNVAAASHLNFVFANSRVIMPIYDEAQGTAAQAALQALLPQHEVIALSSRHILSGGGSFHCISQQIPARDLSKEQTA